MVDFDDNEYHDEDIVWGGGHTHPFIGPVCGFSWERAELNRSKTTVQVPQDEDTIQDALRKVPYRLAANYTIEIDETGGDYGEDVVIPPVVTMDLGDDNDGGGAQLILTRQSGPGGSGRWETSSIHATGGRGQASVIVKWANCNGVNPWDNEDAVFAVYGGGQVVFHDCEISGSARSGTPSLGFLSYASNIKLQQNATFGTDLVDDGGKVKHMGRILVDDTDNTLTGSVTSNAWHLGGGGVIVHNGKGPTAASDFVSAASSKNGYAVSRFMPLLDESGPSEFNVITAQTDGDVDIQDANENPRITLFKGPDVLKFSAQDGTERGRVTGSGTLDWKGDIDIDPSNTYSPSNDTTDRTFDADNTTVNELADVLATLIKDLGMDS